MAAVAAALAAMSIDRTSDPDAGARNLGHLWPFWIASGSAWAALTAVWITLVRTQSAAGRPRPLLGRAAWVILVVAVSARVVVLATHEPALSDDVYRYVFDGRNGAAGVNPFPVVPADRVAAVTEGRDGERWRGEIDTARVMNNPEMSTIYLPASQWVFRLWAALTPDDASPVAAARAVRIVLTVFETFAIVLLLVVLARRGRPAWWCALYAWHPLPLSEIAGSGHQEAIGLALLAAAMALYDGRAKRVAIWTVPLAGAAMIKPMVVPVAAVLLRGRPWRQWLISGAVGVALAAAVCAPMLLADGGRPLASLSETATRFSLKWAHFGSVYEPVLGAIETIRPQWGNDPQEQLARTICLGAALAAILVVWLRGRAVWRSVAAVFLVMVLFSPVVHPWYLLWALLVVPIAPLRAVWVASLTLPWGYAVLGDTVDWTVPGWVMWTAYVPVYAALVVDLLRGGRRPETLERGTLAP